MLIKLIIGILYLLIKLLIIIMLELRNMALGINFFFKKMIDIDVVIM